MDTGFCDCFPSGVTANPKPCVHGNSIFLVRIKSKTRIAPESEVSSATQPKQIKLHANQDPVAAAIIDPNSNAIALLLLLQLLLLLLLCLIRLLLLLDLLLILLSLWRARHMVFL